VIGYVEQDVKKYQRERTFSDVDVMPKLAQILEVDDEPSVLDMQGDADDDLS